MGNQTLASIAHLHSCCPSTLIMGRIQLICQHTYEKSGLEVKLCADEGAGQIGVQL